MNSLLLLVLPVAACGAMMLGCAWLMRRGTSGHHPSADGRAEAPDDEIAALREEVARLRERHSEPGGADSAPRHR